MVATDRATEYRSLRNSSHCGSRGSPHAEWLPLRTRLRAACTIRLGPDEDLASQNEEVGTPVLLYVVRLQPEHVIRMNILKLDGWWLVEDPLQTPIVVRIGDALAIGIDSLWHRPQLEIRSKLLPKLFQVHRSVWVTEFIMVDLERPPLVNPAMLDSH